MKQPVKKPVSKPQPIQAVSKPKRPVVRFNKSAVTSGSSGLGGRSANYGRKPMKKAPKKFFKAGR